MKKIVIDKNEDIAEVIDRILAEPDTAVALVVPRGSTLGNSVRNFHILKREMYSTGRQLEIESVDEQILALAKEAGIPSRHPLLSKANGGSVSDIVGYAQRASETTITLAGDGKNGKKKPAKGKRTDDDGAEAVKIEVREEESAGAVAIPAVDEADAIVDEEEGTDAEGAGAASDRKRFFREGRTADLDGDDDDEDGLEPRRRGPWKGIAIGAGVIIIAAVVFFGVTRFLGRAQVVLAFTKTPWQEQAIFTADKSLAKPNPSANLVPAQVFFETKNVTQLFPASGSATVSEKARGKLTIYNAYSSAPQSLVATTRFVTPDGKIFRLMDQVTVPGAQITNGQIVPSSIGANVIADKPGPDYNVGAVAKLAIPGFEKTPKFAGFYGALPNGTTGGFSGTKAVPIATDVTAAKASTTAILQEALKGAAAFDIPSNFKILDGATNVQIAKLSVNTSTDQDGKFSVFGQVTYQAIGFDESMLKDVLLAQAQAREASSTFDSLSLAYASVKPDFVNGRLGFSVAANGNLVPAFSPDDWKAGLAGLSIADARAQIAAVPQLQTGKISVWPVWLWNIPSDPGRIDVTVN